MNTQQRRHQPHDTKHMRNIMAAMMHVTDTAQPRNDGHTEIPIRDAVETASKYNGRIIAIWPYQNQLINV